jgi:hypothetical protein
MTIQSVDSMARRVGAELERARFAEVVKRQLVRIRGSRASVDDRVQNARTVLSVAETFLGPELWRVRRPILGIGEAHALEGLDEAVDGAAQMVVALSRAATVATHELQDGVDLARLPEAGRES